MGCRATVSAIRISGTGVRLGSLAAGWIGPHRCRGLVDVDVVGQQPTSRRFRLFCEYVFGFAQADGRVHRA